MAIQYARRRFTVDEYHKMGEAGIVSEDDRLELVDGEIVEMTPINVPHAVCVDLLTMLLSRRVPEGVIVRVQSPIYIDEINEPQPDLTVLKPRDYLGQRHHPGPEDILLVIEVSDTTVSFDVRQKVPRYAQAGIAETWIVNLPRNGLEVYTDPSGGKYMSTRKFGRGDVVTATTLPGVTIQVADFLGGPRRSG